MLEASDKVSDCHSVASFRSTYPSEGDVGQYAKILMPNTEVPINLYCIQERWCLGELKSTAEICAAMKASGHLSEEELKVKTGEYARYVYAIRGLVEWLALSLKVRTSEAYPRRLVVAIMLLFCHLQGLTALSAEAVMCHVHLGQGLPY